MSVSVRVGVCVCVGVGVCVCVHRCVMRYDTIEKRVQLWFHVSNILNIINRYQDGKACAWPIYDNLSNVLHVECGNVFTLRQ